MLLLAACAERVGGGFQNYAQDPKSKMRIALDRYVKVLARTPTPVLVRNNEF